MGHAAEQPVITEPLANWISGLTNNAVSPQAYTWARHAMLDWFAVTIAGSTEPLVDMLVQEYAGPGDAPCALFGLSRRARPLDAALINGATGHALDFDDVNASMGGHPTVPVAPVVMALGEQLNRSGRDVLRAFVAGYEAECRIGTMCIPSHYQHGFHATGTLGTFGAAAAAASLLQLDPMQTRHALGMAAAQASGLKSMFGTMTKPLHAGKAAMNGLMAAQLAARGFTANIDSIEAEQGFAATQVPDFAPQSPVPRDDEPLKVQANLFKYHAACYLTHSAIEAIGQIRREHNVSLDDMRAIAIEVPETHKKVCDIREPQTGLNIKFSIRHLAVMALDGRDTADLNLYSDANACDERYARARRLVELKPANHQQMDMMRSANVTIDTKDNRTLRAEANVAIPATDIDAQWQRLVAKTRSIVTPAIGEVRCEALIDAMTTLDEAPDLNKLIHAAHGGA